MLRLAFSLSSQVYTRDRGVEGGARGCEFIRLNGLRMSGGLTRSPALRLIGRADARSRDAGEDGTAVCLAINLDPVGLAIGGLESFSWSLAQ